MVQHQADVFQWECQPKAEGLLKHYLNFCLERSVFLRKLQFDLMEKTSTRLFDWIDHIEVGSSDEVMKSIYDTGFVSQIATPSYRSFVHPGAKLPSIVIRDESHASTNIALSVESIQDFLMVRGMNVLIEGSPFSHFRRACVSKEQGVYVNVVERRGTMSMEPEECSSEWLEKVAYSYERWKTRPRNVGLEKEEKACTYALDLAEQTVETLGSGMAAVIVLDVERQYWQSKNRAAQIQKNRQDTLGMGWANHDHHTFRSSRRYFSQLVRLFEILGFHCRERFYAGEEAGWGAQVMEHNEAKIVLFLDVDLSPQEVQGDFAHGCLKDLDHLGTVGLWCALHGDSILNSGMHHLEAQFSFDLLKTHLEDHGVSIMKPFSHFDYLKQAFTSADHWPCSEERLDALFSKGLITQEQKEHFKAHGAIGSHLENLERNEGYKGFNKHNVSTIIKETDPRKL